MSNQNRILQGDAETTLATLDAGSVDLTVTSPPYFRHRDYGVRDQIGREQTLDDYLTKIRGVLAELLRVTADTGACFFVVGDTYEKQRLLLVPHRIALAAADLGWTVRNDLIWNKQDPPPESPRNRWRSGHEHILFLTKRARGYKFDADEIRVPYADVTVRRWGNGQVYAGAKSAKRVNGSDSRMRHGQTFKLNPKGCLPTDVWSLPSGDSSVAHYATFPERLVEPIIRAASEEGDLVLDPFAGSGTTCAVAARLNRSFLWIELNPDYAKIAAAALGVRVEKLAARRRLLAS